MEWSEPLQDVREWLDLYAARSVSELQRRLEQDFRDAINLHDPFYLTRLVSIQDDTGMWVASMWRSDLEVCPNAPPDDPGHCGHWYDCEPCHRCGDDVPDLGCDCDRCTAVRHIRTKQKWVSNDPSS